MKSKNPTVSVLLPVGKDKRFLKEALVSIRSQTFKDFEILIQEDDGRGTTQVLIDLVKRAKGKFLARMDADDICLPNRFKVQVEYLLAHPDVQLVGSWATLIDESGNQIGLQKMPVDWERIKKEVFRRNPLVHSSWMMRKSWFENVGGYNSAYPYSQDWELLLKKVWKEKIENIPEPLIKLRIHSGSASFSNNRQQVYFGLKARLEAIVRGDVPWYKIIFLLPVALAMLVPSGIKFYFRNILIKDGRLASPIGGVAVSNKRTLGLVMPIGQNKEQLLESGQWNLWQFEIEEYRKHFGGVEVFEFKYRDWRRFFEAKFMPLVEVRRLRQCSVLKAVHLSAAIPCLVAKFLYGTPYVLSFGYRYDEFAKIEKKWLQWIFVKLFEPLAVKFAAAVMVPTEALKSYVKGFGANKVEVIPNGVDFGLFKSDSKGLTLRPQGETLLNILFVGRFEEQKNLETLIKAIYKLFKGQTLSAQGLTLSDVKLVFVGTGSLEDRLVDLADKLGVNLKIKGQIPNEKLPETYQQADIFILPSLAEGHPKVLLEAMSCGLACIASDIPGINEIVTDNEDGLLVEPTVNGFVNGLKKLINNAGLRQRLRIEARKTVLERFDKNRLMDRESELLVNKARPF